MQHFSFENLIIPVTEAEKYWLDYAVIQADFLASEYVCEFLGAHTFVFLVCKLL